MCMFMMFVNGTTLCLTCLAKHRITQGSPCCCVRLSPLHWRLRCRFHHHRYCYRYRYRCHYRHCRHYCHHCYRRPSLSAKPRVYTSLSRRSDFPAPEFRFPRSHETHLGRDHLTAPEEAARPSAPCRDGPDDQPLLDRAAPPRRPPRDATNPVRSKMVMAQTGRSHRSLRLESTLEPVLDSPRDEPQAVVARYKLALQLRPGWEKGYFCLGQYVDFLFKSR